MKIKYKYIDDEGDILIVYDKKGYFQWVFKTSRYFDSKSPFQDTFGMYDDLSDLKLVWPVFKLYYELCK